MVESYCLVTASETGNTTTFHRKGESMKYCISLKIYISFWCSILNYNLISFDDDKGALGSCGGFFFKNQKGGILPKNAQTNKLKETLV